MNRSSIATALLAISGILALASGCSSSSNGGSSGAVDCNSLCSTSSQPAAEKSLSCYTPPGSATISRCKSYCQTTIDDGCGSQLNSYVSCAEGASYSCSNGNVTNTGCETQLAALSKCVNAALDGGHV